MSHRALALALWVGALAAAAPSCSGRSVVTGGAPASGGAFSSGGALVSGGVAGSTVTGGVGIGGASGTPAAGGSLIPVGGASTGGSQTAEGGEGSVVDPYPRVAWEDGQGYRRSCPQYDGVWGFTCWHFDGGPGSSSCSPTGDPYCNACSCAIPCGSLVECPRGVGQHEAVCIGTSDTVLSCFLYCPDGICPAGMTCMRYPGGADKVCVWVSEQPFGQPPL
jgi:hypothetical protein